LSVTDGLAMNEEKKLLMGIHEQLFVFDKKVVIFA
jgi:hypothetical protein